MHSSRSVRRRTVGAHPLGPTPQRPTLQQTLRTRTPAAVVALVALAILLAACSSPTTSTGGGSASGASTTAASTGAPSAPSKSWSELFARVPGYTDVDGASLEAVDVAAARKVSGFSPDGDGRDGRTSELAELGVRFAPSFFEQDLQAWKDVLGIYPYAPERSVEILVPGKDAIVVLEGTFDVAALTAKLKGADAMGADATSESYGGATFLRQPGDEMKVNPKARGFLEELGRPVRVLVAPDHMIVTLTDDGMHRAIDAWSGKGAATADTGFAETVKVLDSIPAVTVYGSNGTDDPAGAPGTTRPSAPARTNRTSATAPRPVTSAPSSGAPARVLLVGSTLHDDMAGAYLVALKSSADDARTASEGIETLVASGASEVSQQPWEDLLKVDDLRTEGTVVLATFTTERPTIVHDAFLRRDNLTAL